MADSCIGENDIPCVHCSEVLIIFTHYLIVSASFHHFLLIHESSFLQSSFPHGVIRRLIQPKHLQLHLSLTAHRLRRQANVIASLIDLFMIVLQIDCRGSVFLNLSY